MSGYFKKHTIFNYTKFKENTQATASAPQRVNLQMRKYPQVAYMAMQRHLSPIQNVDLNQAGFSQLFAHLGRKKIFDRPCHAQSKLIRLKKY
jgi:hypothetical protein